MSFSHPGPQRCGGVKSPEGLGSFVSDAQSSGPPGSEHWNVGEDFFHHLRERDLCRMGVPVEMQYTVVTGKFQLSAWHEKSGSAGSRADRELVPFDRG